MDISKINDGVLKTGFKLEFNISSILTKHGWNVINNKYYVDDLSESVREIDIVAYKASKVNYLDVYTVLIISCKKNEDNAWALCSKKIDPLDPNMDWLPIHVWSNDLVVNHMINEEKWRDQYFKYNKENGSNILSYIPKAQVFAFQEMNKRSGKPNNDKNIFNSIISLMKAQAYEISALPDRKSKPSIYQFNLLSVMETELLRAGFSEKGVDSEVIDDEVYIADYIIKKHQTSAKIHFIKSTVFEEKLKLYDKLFNANVKSFKSIHDDFYIDAYKVSERRNIFSEYAIRAMVYPINNKLKEIDNSRVEIKNLSLSWDWKNETLYLEVETENFNADKLNNDEELLLELASHLKRYYKYNGKSKISNWVPF